MPHISYPYKKTNKTLFQKPASILTDDILYWQKLGAPVLVKEFGAIDYLDFSPVEPHYFAATCSVRVQIYDPITKTVTKNISKFVQAAYGGSFRGDGRLLVAGSEEAVVKLFDVQSKNILRVFNGHTGAVHRTYFSRDQVKVLSFSDDKSVGLWDIATEERVANFTEHSDYIRAGAASPISPDIILSGGYDHLLKLYDCRSNEVVLTVNHGSPVESTLFLPSGGIFISAGGTEIKVWDIFNGGKLLACISQHHKTVTSLHLASNNSRLMSASLDRHVKIFDIATFKQVHSIDFPNAILCLGISKHDDTLAVGMVDGVISIRKREQPSDATGERKGLFKFAPDHIQTSSVDTVINSEASSSEPRYDSYLRRMQFDKALKAVLTSKKLVKEPEKTAAMLQDLLRRNMLHIAMFNLQEHFIMRLLTYLIKYLGETRFTRLVIDVTNIFMNVFEDKIKHFSDRTLTLYKQLQKKISNEIEVCKDISELEGILSLLLSGAQIGDFSELEALETLAPSNRAQREIIIDV